MFSSNFRMAINSLTTTKVLRRTQDTIRISTVRTSRQMTGALIDVSAVGSKSANRFRSVNEFIPHAVWLAKNDPAIACDCKYCSKSKKTQTEISQSLGLSTKRTASTISAPPRQSQKRPRLPPKPPKLPHAAVRQAPQPTKPAPAALLPPPKQTLALDKSNDIYHTVPSSDIQSIRYFRKGELVWCALKPPIVGPQEGEDAIAFWPGLVDNVTTKPITALREDVQSDGSLTPEFDEDGLPRPQITWTVRQHTSYEVKLLALARTYVLTDDDILPYLSYAPSELLLEILRNALPIVLQTDIAKTLANNPDIVSDFNPLNTTLSIETRFTEAIVPYTLAVQIASHIATFWTPTDEWECKFSIPPPSPPTATALTSPPETSASAGLPTHLDGQALSLQDVINTSMGDNARAGPGPRSVSETNGQRASERLQNATQNITQVRYQGLWWGAERIWTDELVRLKLARCQFAPQGTETVYPTAGPSDKAREWHMQNAPDTAASTMGAGEKGMFMRIEGLFVVDIGGAIKECRASGMIYELVDEDWEEPDASQPDKAQSKSKGKGKEKEHAHDGSLNGDVAQVGSISTGPAPQSNGRPRRGSDATSAAISDPSGSLSRPVLAAQYPLPDPPQGYKFHAILPPGNECVLSLSLISGRYYPRLFTHPLLGPVVQKALANPVSEGGLYGSKHLWALEGLLPGIHQSMEPEHWKSSRHVMFKEADTQARTLLKQFINGEENVPIEEPPVAAVEAAHEQQQPEQQQPEQQPEQQAEQQQQQEYPAMDVDASLQPSGLPASISAAV